MAKEGFITVQEAIQLSGYTKSYISRLWRQGKIAGARIGKKMILIEKQSLLDYLASDPQPGRPKTKTEDSDENALPRK